MSLTVGSVFSGIGGFDYGFERAGFEVSWQCEIDPFCRQVLAHHFSPDRLRAADVREIHRGAVYECDVLVGGFPCQGLSMAGQRKGLADARSRLFFEFMRLLAELQPPLFVLENVPGFLSSRHGLNFAAALDCLEEAGYVGGWRTLDSQWFGLAQRCARVFLVGGLGRFGERAQAILFESSCGGWDTSPGSAARADLAATLRSRSARRSRPPGRGGEDDVNLGMIQDIRGIRNRKQHGFGVIERDGPMYTLDCTSQHAVSHALSAARSGQRFDPNGEDYVVASLTASLGHHGHGSDRGDGASCIPFDTTQITSRENRCRPELGDPCHPLAATQTELAYALTNPGSGGRTHSRQIAGGLGVRRLTPLECERLQGFPDGWTCLCGEGRRGSQFCRCTDSARYRALGNAVSVPVAEWIARQMMATMKGLNRKTS